MPIANDVGEITVRSPKWGRQIHVSVIFVLIYYLDVDVNEKYERRRGASLPASSILKNYNTLLRNNF